LYRDPQIGCVESLKHFLHGIGIEAFRVGTNNAPGRVPGDDFMQSVFNAHDCAPRRYPLDAFA